MEVLSSVFWQTCRIFSTKLGVYNRIIFLKMKSAYERIAIAS